MKVSYNGVTGELVKLEQTGFSVKPHIVSLYKIEICEDGNADPFCTKTFRGVISDDIKFLSESEKTDWKSKCEELKRKIEILKDLVDGK